MSTQPNAVANKAADALMPFLAEKFVGKEEGKKAIDAAMEGIRKDLMAEILAAKEAPKTTKSTKNWVVRSQFTGQKREMEFSLGKILHVMNERRTGAGMPSDAKYAAEVDFVKKAISDGSSTAGGSLIPQEWVDFVIPELAARTVVMKAGPNVLPMQHQILNIPGITANQTVAWVGENAAITESDPTTNNTPLTLHAAKFLTGLSLEWLRDATPETDAALQASLVRSLARFVDSGLLNGTGTTQPLGLSQITFPAGNQIFTGNGAANGAPLSYDDFNNLITALDEANAPQEKRCWFMRPKALGSVRGLKDSLGRPLFYDNLQAGALLIASGAITDLSTGPDGFILGYPVYTTTNVPNNLTRGSNNSTSYVLLAAMSDIYVGQGIRSQGMEIAISDQALFANAEIAVRGIWRIDIQPGHTASVGQIGGVE